ncbi:MAG: class I SAM-dependent methyltransferase [Rubrivivax sp.]
MDQPTFTTREAAREARFHGVWWGDLPDVFADVAPYYDRANVIATLGQLQRLLRGFMATIELTPNARVLDLCAGTNAVGIALLEREPTLQVQAMDRSAEMQRVGRERAQARGLHIDSVIGDAHRLPFADAQFDLVTLQFASRHLRVERVFAEVWRVLKPGGRFYHCDMLRPANVMVEALYYAYLRPCLAVTATLFGSGSAARRCQRYFIDALRDFYSAEELSVVLSNQGFRDVRAQTPLLGTVGYHRATKP